MDRESPSTPVPAISQLAQTIAAAPIGTNAARTSCAWKGSLPWHALPVETIEAMLQHASAHNGAGACKSASQLMSRLLPAGRHRDLIEWQTLVELTSAGLVHTELWYLRITAMQAKEALRKLIAALSNDEDYEVGVTRQTLRCSILLRGEHSASRWGMLVSDAHCAEPLVSRTPEFLGLVSDHFDHCWNGEDTIRDRDKVLALLDGRIEWMNRRVIL